MRKSVIILFILLSINVCFSRNMQIPVQFENSSTTIELYNMKGQKVFSKEFIRYNNIPFSLTNNLANQVYIMRVKNGANEFTRKFTPNRNIQFMGFSNNKNIKTRSEDDTDSLSNKTTQQKNTRSTEIDSMTTIIFINGIWNKEDAARENLERIKVAYKDTLKHFPGEYQFKLGYNKSDGKPSLGDITEVVFQLLRDLGISNENISEYFQSWLLLIVSTSDYIEMLKENSLLNIDILDEKLDELLKKLSELKEVLMATTVVRSNDATAADLKRIIDKSFENKERVIIISHSQGNIYSNDLFEKFSEKEKKHSAVLNVATPTTKPATGWYFTNYNDGVIALARAINNEILLGIWNDLLSLDEKDPREITNHNFWESYFSPNLISRTRIDKELLKQCESLPFWEIDSTENYFTGAGGCACAIATTIELLLSNGEYLFVGTFGGCGEFCTKCFFSVSKSDLAFNEFNYPIIKVSYYLDGKLYTHIYDKETKKDSELLSSDPRVFDFLIMSPVDPIARNHFNSDTCPLIFGLAPVEYCPTCVD